MRPDLDPAVLLAAVPDLIAEVTALAEVTTLAQDSGHVWTEWQMSGTRGDGTPHLMRGVIIFTTRDDRICAAKFYLEPVDTTTGDVDAAVHAQLASRP